MIPITDNTLKNKSLAQLQKIKKANIGGLVLTGMLVIALFVMFIINNYEITTLVIAICTSYLPILYLSNLSKINKTIKTK